MWYVMWPTCTPPNYAPREQSPTDFVVSSRFATEVWRYNGPAVSMVECAEAGDAAIDAAFARGEQPRGYSWRLIFDHAFETKYYELAALKLEEACAVADSR